MGKFVKPLDIAIQTQNTLAAVLKYVKSAGCNVGVVSYDALLGNKICIFVENDGKLGSDIASVLSKSERLTVKEVLECKESYDWRADTYCRPGSAILVEFK